MDPMSLMGFALIVGYIMMTMVFTFSMSFQVGMIIGAVGYVIYEMLKILYPFIQIGMSFIKLMKLFGMLFVVFVVYKIIRYLIPSGKKEKKKLR
jgi:apolipoprotein N-acyltransferase